MRKPFANDKLNHVLSCSRVNSSKVSATPFHFFRRSNDGKGLEYDIKPRCTYVGIYYQVKRQYALSFYNNDPEISEAYCLIIN